MKKLSISLMILAVAALAVGIASADTHYVSKTGSNTAPYTTPATASNTIANAITASADYDTVEILDSQEYAESVTLKHTTLRGAVGQNPTIKPTANHAIITTGKLTTITNVTINMTNATGKNTVYGTSVYSTSVTDSTLTLPAGSLAYAISLSTVNAPQTLTFTGLNISGGSGAITAVASDPNRPVTYVMSNITVNGVTGSASYYLFSLGTMSSATNINFSTFTLGNTVVNNVAGGTLNIAYYSTGTISNPTFSTSNNSNPCIYITGGGTAAVTITGANINMTGKTGTPAIHSPEDGAGSVSITNSTLTLPAGSTAYAINLAPSNATYTMTLTGLNITGGSGAITIGGTTRTSAITYTMNNITVNGVTGGSSYYLFSLGRISSSTNIDFSTFTLGNTVVNNVAGGTLNIAYYSAGTISNPTFSTSNNSNPCIYITGVSATTITGANINMTGKTGTPAIYSPEDGAGSVSITNSTLTLPAGSAAYAISLAPPNNTYTITLTGLNITGGSGAITIGGTTRTNALNYVMSNITVNGVTGGSSYYLFSLGRISSSTNINFGTFTLGNTSANNVAGGTLNINNYSAGTISNPTFSTSNNSNPCIYITGVSSTTITGANINMTGKTDVPAIYSASSGTGNLSITNSTLTLPAGSAAYAINLSTPNATKTITLTGLNITGGSGAIKTASVDANTIINYVMNNITVNGVTGSASYYLFSIGSISSTTNINFSTFTLGNTAVNNVAGGTLNINNNSAGTISNPTFSTGNNSNPCIYITDRSATTITGANINMTGKTGVPAIYSPEDGAGSVSITNSTLTLPAGSAAYAISLAPPNNTYTITLTGLNITGGSGAITIGGTTRTNALNYVMSNITVNGVTGSASYYLFSLGRISSSTNINFGTFTLGNTSANNVAGGTLYINNNSAGTISNPTFSTANNSNPCIFLAQRATTTITGANINMTGKTGVPAIYGTAADAIGSIAITNSTLTLPAGSAAYAINLSTPNNTYTVTLTGLNITGGSGAISIGGTTFTNPITYIMSNITVNGVTGSASYYLFSLGRISSSTNIDFSTFTLGNTSANNVAGGTLYINNYSAGTIRNATFNTTTNSHPGILVSNSNTALNNIDIDMTGKANAHGISVVANNYAFTSGASITNSVIKGVTGSGYYGAVLSLYSGTGTVSNCTFYNNVNGVYIESGAGSGTWTMINSIIANNTNYGLYRLSGTVNVSYSDISCNGTGKDVYNVTPNPISPCINGNISQDPLFVNGCYLSHTGTGQPVNSPCIDIGSAGAQSLGLGRDRAGGAAGWSTRTDGAYDRGDSSLTLTDDWGKVDMGKHFRATAGLGWITDITLTADGAEFTEGDNIKITVNTVNSSGREETVLSDTTIDLSTNMDGTFSLSPGGAAIPSVTIAAGTSEKELYYTPNESGTHTLEGDENPSQGWDKGTVELTVASSVDGLVFTSSLSTVSGYPTGYAGQSFTLTLEALNGADPATSFTGVATLNAIIYFNPSSGSSTVTITPTTFDFSIASPPGYVSVTANYPDCGIIGLTATTTVGSTTITSPVYYIRLVPYSFLLAPDDGKYSRVVSEPFKLNITARNQAGSTCPNYRGPATLSVKDYIEPSSKPTGVTLTPNALSTTYWNSNPATIDNVKYNRWKSITMQCTDDTLHTNTLGIGVSKEFDLYPKNFLITISAPPASRDFYYINEEFNVLITAMDGSEPSARISNYGGTVTFTSPSLTKPVNYTYTAADAGTHTFTFKGSTAVTDTTFTVADTAYAASLTTSSKVTVKSGTISPPSSMYAFIGTANAIVFTIKDSSGNVITNDSSTTFKVEMDEPSKDESCKISANYNGPYTDSGVATFTVTGGEKLLYILNSKPEIVTVTPITTDPTINTASGMVHFGSQTSGGLALDKWRDKGDTVRGKVAR